MFLQRPHDLLVLLNEPKHSLKHPIVLLMSLLACHVLLLVDNFIFHLIARLTLILPTSCWDMGSDVNLWICARANVHIPYMAVPSWLMPCMIPELHQPFQCFHVVSYFASSKLFQWISKWFDQCSQPPPLTPLPQWFHPSIAIALYSCRLCAILVRKDHSPRDSLTMIEHESQRNFIDNAFRHKCGNSFILDED